MIITAIQQAKKNLDHVNIFADNAFWINISKDELAKFGLAKGMEITPELKSTIEESSQQTKLIEKVYSYQSLRPHSITEIRNYLTLRRQVDPLAAAQIIDILVARGHLSDEQFARWYIANRAASGKHGPNKIKAELLQKGVSVAITKAELDHYYENTDQNSEQLHNFIIKLQNQVKAATPQDKQRKIIQRLMARGFPYDTIKQALKSLPHD